MLPGCWEKCRERQREREVCYMRRTPDEYKVPLRSHRSSSMAAAWQPPSAAPTHTKKHRKHVLRLFCILQRVSAKRMIALLCLATILVVLNGRALFCKQQRARPGSISFPFRQSSQSSSQSSQSSSSSFDLCVCEWPGMVLYSTRVLYNISWCSGFAIVRALLLLLHMWGLHMQAFDYEPIYMKTTREN